MCVASFSDGEGVECEGDYWVFSYLRLSHFYSGRDVCIGEVQDGRVGALMWCRR